MWIRGLVLAAALAAVAPPVRASPAEAASREIDDAVFGVWQNPKETVQVEIRPCGAYACGVVVWATPEAEEKVQQASGKRLLGLELFKDMVRTGKGIWRGKTFVPDLNISLTGVAQVVTPGSLHARGCLIAGVLCRSQNWKKVDDASP